MVISQLVIIKLAWGQFFYSFLGDEKHKNQKGQTFRPQMEALFSAIDSFFKKFNYQEYLGTNNLKLKCVQISISSLN